jgi:hypothetical protein
MEECIQKVDLAVSHGHRDLAAKLVSEAVRIGGFGFNFLHEEVSLCDATCSKELLWINLAL